MRRVDVGPEDGKVAAVFVHGNDLCGEFYRPLAERLARRGVRSLLLTMPGFAGVPAREGAGWPELVTSVAEVVSEAAAGRPRGAVLVGHSLGGVFAFLTAARRPRGLRGLVLMEPPTFPTRRMAVSGARKYIREVVQGDRSVFENWSGTTNRIHRVEWFPPEALAIHMEARRTTDPVVGARLLEALPKMYPLPYADVEVPALVLRGAHSGWRMHVNLQLLVRRLPRASLLTIPGCAHFMANEADAALAEAIGAFAGAAG